LDHTVEVVGEPDSSLWFQTTMASPEAFTATWGLSIVEVVVVPICAAPCHAGGGVGVGGGVGAGGGGALATGAGLPSPEEDEAGEQEEKATARTTRREDRIGWMGFIATPRHFETTRDIEDTVPGPGEIQ
jgi:hypothetical protein